MAGFYYRFCCFGRISLGIGVVTIYLLVCQVMLTSSYCELGVLICFVFFLFHSGARSGFLTGLFRLGRRVRRHALVFDGMACSQTEVYPVYYCSFTDFL